MCRLVADARSAAPCVSGGQKVVHALLYLRIGGWNISLESDALGFNFRGNFWFMRHLKYA